tara:strand:+ start:466 stop:705 length:240 start_codon:yes stop_codon:yes gene_type:complete
MTNYLNTLITEKNLNVDTLIEVEGNDWGTNFIPLECVIEFIAAQNKATQDKVKATLVKIDFHNGDIMHFFKYIAKGMAM